MKTPRLIVLPSSLAIALLLACGGQESQTDTAAMRDTAPMTAAAAPDTTAEALWAHLEQQNYRERWQMWPGKGRLYTGQEPHGMLLTTYVNALAHDALTNGAARMPAGAIIVKENYMRDSTFAAATVMHKVTGYDSANSDWFWMKRNADGTVDGAGRVGMCIQCHGSRRTNDFIFTSNLAGQ